MSPWTRAAVEAARRAAKTRAGRKALQSAAGAVGGVVAKSGSERYGHWQEERRQRELAYTLARQLHGRLSKAVFIGSDRTHLVVWKDDVPVAAFPPVEGDLAERAELQHVTDADRFDPPPPKSKRRA